MHMKHQWKISSTRVYCLFFFLLATLLCPTASSGGGYSPVNVRRVVDGDTIEIAFQGEKEHVRLIGVDTPETKHPTKPVQPYGPEASEFTKKALTGRKVWLEFDVEQRDHYGRLLAYIWLTQPEGEVNDQKIREDMFNARLLLDGYAQLLTVPPNIRYVDFFKTYQTEAREANRGLWGLESKEKSSSPDNNTVESEYVGNKNSLVFHRPSCDGARTVSAKNRVSIESREKAIKEGFKPCPICKP